MLFICLLIFCQISKADDPVNPWHQFPADESDEVPPARWKSLGQQQVQGTRPQVALDVPPIPAQSLDITVPSTQLPVQEFAAIDEIRNPAEVATPLVNLTWWELETSKPLLREKSSRSISLAQALQAALQNAPELAVLRNEWRIRELEIGVQDAAFDWANFVNAVWNRDSNPVGSDLDGAARRLRNRTSNAAVGWRRLLRDGGQFQVSQSIGTRQSNSQFINPNNQGNSRLELEYQRPLLRGGGQEYNTAAIQQAVIETDSAFDQFQIGVQDYLLEVASAYWILVMQRSEFLVQAMSWKRANEIAIEMENRTLVDVTPAMLDRTKAEAANRLTRVIEAKHDLVRAQNTLLRLIYGAQFEQHTQIELVTSTLPTAMTTVGDVNSHIQTALQTRQEIQRAIRDIKLASVRYNLAENELLPVLNLTLTGYLAGLRANNDVGGSFFRQFSEGEPGLGIGLDFEIPYRNREAQAAAEQAKVAILRMRAELQTVMADVSADVYEQHLLKQKFAAILPQQQEALLRTFNVLEVTKLRRQGLVDGSEVADLYLENILQQQARLAAAESAMVQSTVRLALAEGAVQRSIGMIDKLVSSPAAPATIYAAEPNRELPQRPVKLAEPSHAFLSTEN